MTVERAPREVLVAGHRPEVGGALVRLVGRAGAVAVEVGDLVEAGGREREPALVVAEWHPGIGSAPRPPGALVLVCEGEPEAEVWRDAVLLRAEHVVTLPDGQAWLTSRVRRAVADRPAAPLVAVVGGRGGAGASTLAAALAVTAGSRDLDVTLLDLDPLGGGLDLLLGAEGEPGLRWGDLRHVSGRLPAGLLAATAVRAAGVTLVTWERDAAPLVAAETVAAVLERAGAETDLVVADLPRRIDDVARAVLTAARRVLVVVPAEVRAVAAAARVAAEVEQYAADVSLVVRGPAPTGLSAEAVCDAVGLPLAGELRAEPGLAAALDRGDVPPIRPKGPLATLSARLLVSALAAP